MNDFHGLEVVADEKWSSERVLLPLDCSGRKRRSVASSHFPNLRSSVMSAVLPVPVSKYTGDCHY